MKTHGSMSSNRLIGSRCVLLYCQAIWLSLILCCRIIPCMPSCIPSLCIYTPCMGCVPVQFSVFSVVRSLFCVLLFSLSLYVLSNLIIIAEPVLSNPQDITVTLSYNAVYNNTHIHVSRLCILGFQVSHQNEYDHYSCLCMIDASYSKI